jgi:hypothetical protein
LFVRVDAYGRYLNGDSVTTEKSVLLPEVVEQHFSATAANHIIGAHSTVAEAIEGPDGQEIVSCTSKWCCNDVDWHNPLPPPPSNEAAALVWHDRAAKFGFSPLTLETSPGGFRIWILLSEPIQTSIAYKFIRWLQHDWRDLGLACEPETFPRQPRIAVGAFGNWVRLPGKHPRHAHYTRIWDGSEWLTGDRAVEHLLSLQGDPASLIPAESLQAVGSVRESARGNHSKPQESLPLAESCLRSDTPMTTESRLSSGDPWEEVTGPPEAPAPRPGDELGEKLTWPELLKPHGWKFVGEAAWSADDQSGTCQRWRRPGKDHGHSATIGFGGDWLHVFTSETAFKQGETYSKFGVYAVLNCGGDHSEAARRLRALGFGGSSANGPVVAGTPADTDDDTIPLDVCPWPDPPQPEAYHGSLGRIVRAIEPHTEADPLGILAHLIAMFGNVIGRNAYVQVEATRHYLNEFMITVGRSALSRKGTAGDRAKHVFSLLDAVWADDRIKDGLSSGEGLATAVKDPVEGRVAIKEKGRVVDWQVVVTDPGVADKRLFILESEFGGVLRALQREGNRLSALIRQAWDSGNLRSLTKTPWVATNAHISIVGHITAMELLHLLSEIDFVNGFANRFWWFAVRGGAPLPFGGTPEGMADLTAQLEDAIKDARLTNRIALTPEARDLWKSSMYGELRNLPVGRLGEILNRSAPHVLRVAGIFCLADRVQVIEPCHLRAAKALWDASVRCASFIFGDSLGDPVAEKILGALREVSPAGLTRTELHAVLQRHVSTIRIKQALAVLISGGVALETREVTAGGRLAWKYYALANSANSANSARQ